MPTGLTYASYQTLMATLAVTSVTDPNFVSILASMIDNAELRICQDLDLISNQVIDLTFACVANHRNLGLPSDLFVTLENITVLTPAGTVDPAAGTRNPCTLVSKEVMDVLYPSVVGAGVPNKVAIVGQFVLMFGPWPNLNYSLEITGTQRPLTLSASNTNTFISRNLPHLLIAASMVYISAYQRNFGRMSDDPQMAVSWENYYMKMLGSSDIEEARKKWEGPAWTPKSPAKVASPTRGIPNKAAA